MICHDTIQQVCTRKLAGHNLPIFGNQNRARQGYRESLEFTIEGGGDAVMSLFAIESSELDEVAAGPVASQLYGSLYVNLKP